MRLAEITTQINEGAHAVPVCDGAGWHQAGERLIVPDNTAVLRLPPYAPALNPVENVRQHLPGNRLNTRAWSTADVATISMDTLLARSETRNTDEGRALIRLLTERRDEFRQSSSAYAGLLASRDTQHLPAPMHASDKRLRLGNRRWTTGATMPSLRCELSSAACLAPEPDRNQYRATVAVNRAVAS